ncbi:DUF7848 domain-containing protein, partial [Kitasatospora griseola]|uniref:DUF7848 domain-containing protein n=1 Tax=Kitasatospora griseola TaxID=2064 RepID=UPI00380B5865
SQDTTTGIARSPAGDRYRFTRSSDITSSTSVAVSVEFNDLDAVQGWACVHMMRHPDHRSYRMIADVPMVLVPYVEPK